jgi:fucose permease
MGPAIMTGVLTANYPWQRGYLLVGGWQLLLGFCFALTRKWWPRTNAPQKHSNSGNGGAASSASTLRLPVVWLSLAVFFTYTGTEAAAGVWAYSLLTESRSVPMITAGMWVSIYWGALTVGRLLSGIVVNYVSVRLLLRYCIIGIAAGAALMWLNVANIVSCLGLGLMGLASAPIFPSLIATTPARLGEEHTSNAIGFQIAAAALGQSLLPTIVGVVAHRLGLEIVGPAFLTAALVLLVLYEALLALSARAQRAAHLVSETLT